MTPASKTDRAPEGRQRVAPVSYTCLYYHIVFSTKERRPVLSPDLLVRTCQYIGGIARNLRCHVMLGNGVADHINLAASIHPSVALAEFVKTIKSNSTGWIHETFAENADFGWQDGYSGFTVSKSGLPQVIAYIENQQTHHKRISFQDELVRLRKRHGVDYDERFL